MLYIDKYRKKSPAKQVINKVLQPCFQVIDYTPHNYKAHRSKFIAPFISSVIKLDFIVYLRCEIYMPGGLR